MKERKTPFFKRPIVRILLIWAIQAFALLVMAWIMKSVTIDSVETAVIAAAVIGF
ncbi:MAG: phage holin family protein [Chloroflexi bacterium]|nr:phage holin family protein [Chloroflexota bacterium]